MNIRPLSSQLQQKAIKELNELPSRLRDDLDHIQQWIRQQPHLNARSEDQWLLGFLRACKFSLQKTKEKLDLYYTVRTISPYYFQNRNPFSDDVQTYCKSNVLAMLPEDSNPMGPIRVLIVAKNADPDKSPLKACIRVVAMILDIYLSENDAAIVNGQEVIFDLKDVSYKYHGQCTPSTLKTIAVLLQRAYPTRLKGIHFINVPPLFYVIVKTFISFLPKKLRNRMHIYLEKDFDRLYDAIPRAILPAEYGGDAGPLCMLTEKIRLKMESYKQWFEEDAQYCTDESKRPGKPITSDEYFNVEGSFRKLEID